MIRPQAIKNYDYVDLKLAIKSSFPNAKSTLALLIMLWKASNAPANLNYSKSHSGGIIIAEDIAEKLINYYSVYFSAHSIASDYFISLVNSNQLFKSQLEPLLVGIELVWRIARISFVDGRAQSSERTGGNRFSKTLAYTSNIDIIDVLISSNNEVYSKVLLNWLGCDISINAESEHSLIRLLTCLAEDSVYRMEDKGKEIIFNSHSLYSTLLENNGLPVDINGDSEPKGSLRTLKSALSEGLNVYLNYKNDGSVLVNQANEMLLESYQHRVNNYLSVTMGVLHGLRYIKQATTTTQDVSDISTTSINSIDESKRIKGGANYLLYGVPGSGKSHTVKTEYCDDEERMERVVFHPDYTYSDFVGQIMPKLDEERRVYYDFNPGPFTRMLRKAYRNPSKEFFLVIEELNRGNAPAIFGEVFQLLDRKEQETDGAVGESAYGITNHYVSAEVYGNPDHPTFIPSNLNIVATMNTSDQNVFTLDTAFQRRWRMRMIENNIEEAVHANHTILDTTITWKQFNISINKLILETNLGLASSEDKRLGAYFVTALDLQFSDTGNTKEDDMQNSRFPEKVLKYLWDDAFKFSRNTVFNTDIHNSLEEVIKAFKTHKGNKRFTTVFREGVLGDIEG